MESPDLDPTFRDWLARKQSRARLQLGLSFKNLNVHGFVSSDRVQPTVASYALAIPNLAWRLLSKKADQRVQILHGLDGLLSGGEMLLVLGRPGSGCTTFLKTLAGDTHGVSIGDGSLLNYEGIPYESMHRVFKGESIYLAETDVHFPELTLGQTLTFAASTREAGAQRKKISQTTGRNLATWFNLENAFDTWIGNAMIPGVSGGEKRRTSIAEALIGGARLQCWDNSTRGLDSATAQRFIELLRVITDTLGATLALSIYQASEAMFDKFDKVTLLYEGRQIYFGPTEAAAEYFVGLGFERPPHSTTPDFLTSITHPEKCRVREGFENQVPRSPDDFARAWKQSVHARQLVSDIDKFNVDHPTLVTKPETPKEKLEWRNKMKLRTATYWIPIHMQILITLQRGFQRLRNLPSPVIGSVVANGILALVIGSVYYDLPETSNSMDKRALLIFLSTLLTALSPSFEVLTIWAQRPIVEKHSRYAFYHPFTDAAAAMICDLPNKFFTALLFQVTLYFMTHLRRTPAAFFIWLLFNVVLVLNMSMWFRFIGSISRTMDQTTAPTCILILLAVIYAGFVVPVPYMVSWLQWFRRVNPIAYGYESLMINEFHDRRFPCSVMIPEGPSYKSTDLGGRICSVVGSVAGQTYVQGNSYLSEKFTYHSSNLWRNLAIMVGMTAIVCALHLTAAQFVPAQRSKGDMVQFRRADLKRRVLPDSENVAPLAFPADMCKRDQKAPTRPGAKTDAEKSAIQEQASILHWKDLSYEVKVSNGIKKILNSIDGWVEPGKLTALMGVTGAGKTTLLDVLAERVSLGSATGSICIDGAPRDARFQRKIGYAQQEDIHLPTATVREALQFSATLRQADSTSEQERSDYIDSIIDILDMNLFADAVVGVPGDGLNIEQRRRLTIGIELVAKPELLLFLDEPTSGLDSQTAWSICVLLRKLADNGRAILCTIHQPSAELFRMFDRVLLLSDEGGTNYFGDIGPDASTMISYFEDNGAATCCSDANPAEWVLNVTSSKKKNTSQPEILSVSEESKINWSEKWASSQEKQDVARRLSDIGSQPKATAIEQHHGEFARPWLRQFSIVSERIFQDYWRSPTYVYSKIALCVGVALFNGLSFQNASSDIQGVTNTIFSMFLLTQMFGTLDQQVIPRLIDGRDLFEAREQRSKTYGWTVFLTSNITVEILWQTIAAVLVFITWYYPTGLWRNADPALSTESRGALSFMSIWLFCIWIITFSQAVGAGIQHSESAIQLATLVFWFSLVFCGVLVPPADLPGFWVFVYRASPLTYLMNGLISAGLGNTAITCSPKETLVITPPVDFVGTCGTYLTPYVQVAGGTLLNPEAGSSCQYCPVTNTNALLARLGISTSVGWKNIGYLSVFIIFNILATFGVYWLARVPKKRKQGKK